MKITDEKISEDCPFNGIVTQDNVSTGALVFS
jgi:hypothetical protein